MLGPLEVEGANGSVALGGPTPRRVLVALLAGAGSVVTIDALMAAAWGQHRPASAEKTLQSHLARLRESLVSADSAGDVISSNGRGVTTVDAGRGSSGEVRATRWTSRAPSWTATSSNSWSPRRNVRPPPRR